MADLLLDDLHWSNFNRSGKPITLYGSKKTPFVFEPNARFVLPKQVEGLNAIREYKATLLSGGFGGGKSVWLEQCAFDLFFEWLIPGHYHGPIRPDSKPCMLSHENVRIGLVGQAKSDMRLRHVEQILLPKYGQLGTYNQNEFEFTLHPEYGSGMLTILGTDNLQKLRSMEFAGIGHDECTLDGFEVFDMLLDRLRWNDLANGFTFPHCPWFGATNTTGISRADYRENFVYHPRDEYIDEKSGEKFPGFYHIPINAEDNPILSADYVHRLGEGSEEEVDIRLRGSWERNQDGMFEIISGVHTIEDFPIPDDWQRCLAFDFGWDHPAVMESFALNPYDGQIIHHLVWSMDQKSDRDQKIEMYEYARDMGYPIEGASIRVGDIAAKRGDAKLKASGLAESSTWKFMNTPLQHGNILIPSFNLRPAWKKRVEGWMTVRNELTYVWQWRSPDGIADHMTADNRYKHITRKPGTVIFKSCWQTINSLTNLQRDKKIPGVERRTTGRYGPGRGDDESATFRYGIVAMRKGLYGRLKEEEEIEEEVYNPRQHRRRIAEPKGSVWAR